MTIKILTDSTSDISLIDAQKMDIEIVPLSVNFENEEYIDKYTITNEEFYEKLKTSRTIPTTTLVNPEKFTEVFNKYADDEIIGIFISSKLSGTFLSAVIAKEDLHREDIFLIDSETTTIGLALLVEQAVKMKNSGMRAKDIFDLINQLVPKVELIAIFDTLKYLVKGGRMSNTKGILGSVLGIKPIIRLKNGHLSNIGKERGMEKAIKFLIKQIATNSNLDKNMPLAFAYTGYQNRLPSLMVKFTHACEKKVYSIGSVVGTHAGPGAIAVSFFNQ